tara:strand:- start:122 stop:361 length:240 start_codon:yes stop_codon:yes gene_type:complete
MGPVRSAEVALAGAADRLAGATDAVIDMGNSREDRENGLWMGAMIALSEYNKAKKDLHNVRSQLPWTPAVGATSTWRPK